MRTASLGLSPTSTILQKLLEPFSPVLLTVGHLAKGRGTMMQRLLSLLIFVLLFPSLGLAGEIFGTLTMNGRPQKGVKIEVTESNRQNIIDQAATDRFGRYRLYVKKTGPVKLKAFFQKAPYSLNIMSYEKSARYNLKLIKIHNRYELQRR